MPQVELAKGVQARLIAGPLGERKGKFETVQVITTASALTLDTDT